MSKSPLIRSFALAAALLTAGCLPPPATFQPGPEWAMAASVGVLPLVGSSRQVQAVTAYGPGDVEWLRLKLYTVAGSETEVQSVDVPKASIGNVITFQRLKYQTAYRVRAWALDASMNVISQPNVFVDLTTAGNRDDAPPPVSLTVPLLDKAFEAEGTFQGIEFQTGGFEPYGFVDDFANQQTIVEPKDVCVDRAGNVYVIDGHAIRMMDSAGSTIELIGLPGIAGFALGLFGLARFDGPRGLALRENDDGTIKELYVADTGNHSIRVIDLIASTVATVAGDGVAGYDNDASSVARFNAPEGVAVTDEGHVFVADTGNHAIRLLDPEVLPSDPGYVKTLAGPTDVEGALPGYMDDVATAARFNQPAALALGEAGLFIADRNNHAVRELRFPDRDITTVAGNGASGVADATGTAARFNGPSGLVTRGDGILYVADSLNHTIRRIDAGRRVTTLAGDALAGPGYISGLATRQAARFDQPLGLALWRDADGQGHLFVADSQNGRIRKIR